MPAIDEATIWTGYFHASTGPVPVGKCIIANSSRQNVVVATLENRTAHDRTTSVSGITITEGDSNNPQVRIQTVGPCPPEITGLGAGDASPIVVGDDGSLERKTSPTTGDIVAGKCDADGYAYLNFGGGGGGDGNAISIQDFPVSETDPTNRQILIFDGTSYVPGSLSIDDLTAAFNVTMGGAQTVEVGATVTTPAFTAAYTGGPATSATLTDNDGSSPKALTTPFTSVSSDASPHKTTNNASVTYTITALKGAVTDTSSVIIAWRPRCYFGAHATGTFDEAFIEGLASNAFQSSKATTFTVNAGASQFIYYAIPTSYGTPVFTVGGFEGGFAKVGSAVSVTNAQGVTQNYDVWESDNPNLGSTTVVVS